MLLLINLMYNFSMNKILIADDTKSWLVFHEATIRNIFGNYFEITTAGCAKEALNIAKRNAANPFGIIGLLYVPFNLPS